MKEELERGLLIVEGSGFQIARGASLRAHFDMLSVVDCCLKSGAVEQSILVCGFCWMRLLK